MLLITVKTLIGERFGKASIEITAARLTLNNRVWGYKDAYALTLVYITLKSVSTTPVNKMADCAVFRSNEFLFP